MAENAKDNRIAELEAKLGACEAARKAEREAAMRYAASLETARKALLWYANYDTWKQWPHADGGDRARKALAQIANPAAL